MGCSSLDQVSWPQDQSAMTGMQGDYHTEETTERLCEKEVTLVNVYTTCEFLTPPFSESLTLLTYTLLYWEAWKKLQTKIKKCW